MVKGWQGSWKEFSRGEGKNKYLCGCMEYGKLWFFVLLRTENGARDNVGGSNWAVEVKQERKCWSSPQ